MTTVIVNGFFVGMAYALLAVGLVVVYRGSRVINFAHGETGMLAAFVFTDLRLGRNPTGFTSTDHGLILALPAAILFAAALGAVTEALVARPLRNAPRLRPMVGTFAIAAMFVTFAVRQWGVDIRYTEPLVAGDGVRVAGLRVQAEQMLIAGVTAAVLLGLWALYRFTAFGLRLRAVALDPYAAGLLGVNVDRISLAVWGLAGALAGTSAILIAPLVAFNVFFMATLMVRAVAAALVGGLTSLWGTVVAGLMIGIVESVIAFKSPISGITDAALAGFILVLVLVRPAGMVRTAY